MNLGSIILKSVLLCPRLHYHHQRISSLRSTQSSHTLHQGGRGNGSISYEKLQLPISPLNCWCLTICGRALTLPLPTKATKCPILKRPDESLVHLVIYQIALEEPRPRKECEAPASFSPNLRKKLQTPKASILGKWANPAVLLLHTTPLQRTAWSIPITSPKPTEVFLPWRTPVYSFSSAF